MEKQIGKLTETQEEVLKSLTDSYERYNSLVQRIIETVDRDYTSVYGLKKAVLTALSQSLGGRK